MDFARETDRQERWIVPQTFLAFLTKGKPLEGTESRDENTSATSHTRLMSNHPK